jgi:hypothetical protein
MDDGINTWLTDVVHPVTEDHEHGTGRWLFRDDIGKVLRPPHQSLIMSFRDLEPYVR